MSPNLRKFGYRLLAILALVFFLAASHSHAQTVFGSMSGAVTDPTGAVIPHAKVSAENQETGVTRTTETTSAGAYRFSQLPIGRYNVTVTAPGFKPETLSGVQITLQVTTALNVTMHVGGATQTVTVNASAPQLQTATSDITGSITAQAYRTLPMDLGGVGALRSPEAFIFLLPGNTGPGTSNNNSNGIFFDKISGGQDFGAEVLIDGLSQQRSENGSSFDEEAPSVEALRMLTVTNSVPPAQFNRTTGGIENFVTKSGTNHYHGTAYELFHNTALDANSWFNGGNEVMTCTGASDTPACRARFATPVDRKNDYGGTLGGPVWIPKVYNGHNRLFFFFSWEQIHFSQGGSTVTTVPTAQELSGDFSNPAIFNTHNVLGTNPCDGTPIFQGQIFNPATTRVVNGTECRTAFPDNKIPTQDFSPVALKLLKFFPAPTNGSTFNNFAFRSSSPITDTTYTVRIDANVTQKSKIWSSYSTRDNNRISGAPPRLPYPIDFATWKQDFDTHFWRLGWDYTITPTLLNHLIIGSNRSNSINSAVPVTENVNWMQQVGLGNAVSKNFPVVTNGVTAQEGMPNNGDNIDNGLRLVESVAWQKGAQSFDFGTDDRYQQYSPLAENSPSVNFCGAQTAADPTAALSGNGLASELLGDACGGAQSVHAHQSRWISWYFSGYVQDDWRVTPDLTLNLGLNYSVDKPRHEADNFTSNFSATAIDPEYDVPGALVFGSTCHGCNTAWADTYYKDVSPRVGFAWTPPFLHHKTVLRGAGGIIYGPLQYDDFGGSMSSGYTANPSFPSKNGFDPSFNIDNGYPAFAPPPDLDPGLFNGRFMSGSYIEKKAGKPAEVYQWNLQIQQELARNLILSVGYVGSAAQSLQANNQNINNMPLKDIKLGNELTAHLMNNPYGVPVPFPGYFNLWGNGITIQQALRPFPQYDFIDSGCCLQNTGHSSYDALLVSLHRQFSNGLMLQASYTWSKNLNDTDSILPNTNPGQPQVQNPANLHDEKAISIQDIPSTFVLSYIYKLPFGHGERYLNHGPLSYIVGGWQVGGIQRYQTGEPLAFCCATGIPGWQQSIYYSRVPGSSIKSAAYRRGHVDPFPALFAPIQDPGGDPNVSSFFNGSTTNGGAAYHGGDAQPAFFDQNLFQYRHGGAYRLGNVPRVTGIRMPAWKNEDFSLMKDTPIHGNVVFEIKADFLNAFNRHMFGAPDTNPGDILFGVPTYTANFSREIQITGRINF